MITSEDEESCDSTEKQGMEATLRMVSYLYAGLASGTTSVKLYGAKIHIYAAISVTP